MLEKVTSNELMRWGINFFHIVEDIIEAGMAASLNVKMKA